MNQDTATLFTGKNNPAMAIDDTIFFGILVSQTRSRSASGQGKLGGGSSLSAFQQAFRTRSTQGPAFNGFVGSIDLARAGSGSASPAGGTRPIHSFSDHAGYLGYVIGDRRSIENQFPTGINETDGRLEDPLLRPGPPVLLGARVLLRREDG